jgi:hypothetical protein
MTALAAFTITISSGVYADDIYKWTDEDGNIHYGDRPTGAPTEERLQLTYNRTNNRAVSSRVKQRNEIDKARRDAQAEAEENELSAADAQKAAEEKVAECNSYRERMKTMLEAPRVYRTNEAGERVYLDDAARDAARTQAEEYIKQTCGD